MTNFMAILYSLPTSGHGTFRPVYSTELLFLPGLHHLHTDLIIQNAHNISLIGSATNGTTPDTVIQCSSSVGIVYHQFGNETLGDKQLYKAILWYTY